jgi:hypothetical protein
MARIIVLLLSSLALSACALRGPSPFERGYSMHYRECCEKHDLCDFHGGRDPHHHPFGVTGGKSSTATSDSQPIRAEGPGRLRGRSHEG